MLMFCLFALCMRDKLCLIIVLSTNLCLFALLLVTQDKLSTNLILLILSIIEHCTHLSH